MAKLHFLSSQNKHLQKNGSYTPATLSLSFREKFEEKNKMAAYLPLHNIPL